MVEVSLPELTPGSVTAKIGSMKKGRVAGLESRRRHRYWQIFAASAAVLLLTVQIGLAAHGASHLHAVGHIDDCRLCLLNSSFVAETPSVLDLDPVRTVVVLSPEKAEVPADSNLLVPVARGPPFASV